ncbi:hypothetical protein [Candidatus Protochlamydia sp. W-9]|uniref:hypothetical protein n=1 Tax=Candidatus Protochlamydia sp. W-9 TaxID=1785087 RepID=UPI00096A713A|nr:hypothetical protein [Candidatus Protochlamydia sp. W-9]
MTINLRIENPGEIIINSFNVLNSCIQFQNETQINDETGYSSSPPSAAQAAAKNFFREIGAPSLYSKSRFLADLGIQMAAFFNFGLYRFYFYQIKDISDFTDSAALSLRLDKTKQIADKAIQEYQACMQLMTNGIAREAISFIPTFILDCFCDQKFVKITKIIESDLLAPPLDYAVYLMDQFSEDKLENFRLFAQKVKYLKLPPDSWSFIDCEQLTKTIIPAEIYVKVHHRAMSDIKELLHQHFVTKLERDTVDEYVDISSFFQIQKKRVEVYEQHQSG